MTKSSLEQRLEPGLERKLAQGPLGASPRPRLLVTGATSGIGRELALQLAEAGIPVLALGRNRMMLDALEAAHANIQAVAADLHDVDALPGLARALVNRFPDLRGLINNAGIQHNLRIDDASYDSIAILQEIQVNLSAPAVLAHALLPHFQAQGAAWIVNVTSALGYAPKRTAAIYSATKAALHLFTQALRVQLRGSSVRVVEAVMPLVDTPMTAGRGHGKLPAAQAARELIAALADDRLDIRIGKARAVPLLQRFAPGVLARVLQRA